MTPTNTDQHIALWLDATSDPSDPVWCVSLCAQDGEEIACLSWHQSEDNASLRAEREAATRGLRVVIHGA